MSKLFNNKNELDLELDSVICSSFNRYAKYIIQDRALPDIRDGLKPVQRRILYAMYNLGLFYNKPYKKAARTVGEVIGKYHPHGDSSIYDALVRMSQSWKNNLCLVEMHGNNGSIDGDSAAAMRYTEARLSFYGQTLLDNIEKKIVKFIDNFDDCEKEPSVLPASLPNLLINGATGIAAGYATNIPPFNLNEVCDAVIYVLDNENARTDDLLKIMPGPDFPTAGIVQSKTGIKDFYTTGKGKIVIKAKAQIIDLDNIVQIKIVEIPFDVNKALLVKSIDDIRIENKIPGIIEVRDESDKNGIAICIDIEKHRNINAIQAYLFKNTKLQISYSVNIVVIENRKPVQKGIKEILDSYIKWINKLIIANAKYDLDNLIARQEIVEGMLKALSQIDQLIDLIRSSNSKADAINKIVAYFNLTQKQADAVVSLRLYNLTNFDIAKLNSELSDISLKIIDKKLIIDNKNHRKNIIKNLLNNYKINFGRKRLSKIEDQVDEYEFNQSDVIDVVTRSIVVSQGGYIKYTNDYLPNISSILNLKYKSDDLPIYFNSKLNTLQHLFVITSKARCISIPAFKIKPCLSKYNLGIHINELTTLDIDEKILLAFSANKLLLQEMKLLLASKNNFIKIIETADFAIANTVKVQSCMKLKKDDQLVSCVILEDDASDVVVATTKGNILKYKIDEIPLLKRQAAGVINLKLKNNDSVCCVTTVVDFDSAIIIFANSKLKKIKASDLETSKRGYSGRKCFLINTTDDMVIALSCVKKDNFIIVNDNEKNYLLNHETIDFANFYDKFKKSALLYKIANLNDQASALYNKENNTNDKC